MLTLEESARDQGRASKDERRCEPLLELTLALCYSELGHVVQSVSNFLEAVELDDGVGNKPDKC